MLLLRIFEDTVQSGDQYRSNGLQFYIPYSCSICPGSIESRVITYFFIWAGITRKFFDVPTTEGVDQMLIFLR